MLLLSRLFAVLTLVVLISCGGGGGGGGGAGSGGNVSNANLALLNISVGNFNPGFSSGNLAYSATVGFINQQITITAVPAATNSAIDINGNALDSFNSITLPLTVGENVFLITLSSGGITKQYKLTITRQDRYDVETYLKASNAEAFDSFGLKTSISGETIAVSAYQEDSNGSSGADNTVIDSGAVYIYVKNGNGWEQQAYIKASNPNDSDVFGSSVAISGDTLVVGAPLEDSNGSSEADNSSIDSGAVYVFTRTGTSWSQQAYLKASNLGADDRFGTSVAISGDTIIATAVFEDGNGSNPTDNSVSNAGAAYVFTRTGTVWTQQAYLKASNADADDMFGNVVSIDADTLVIGAETEDGNASSEADNSLISAGAAYVFTRTAGVWSQQAYLKASNAGMNDLFSTSLAVDGDLIVVGAKNESSNGSSEADDSAVSSGAAYVFSRTGSAWTQQAYIKASNVDAGDLFGSSVAIKTDSLIVGAAGEASSNNIESNNTAPNAGAAYVFTQSGSIWSQQYYLKAFNAEASDQFGMSVDFDNDLIVVGASAEDSNGSSGTNNTEEDAGAAYIYQ
jgi:hypothetical protein